MTAALHTELWTSWASVLRSYAAAHGLHARQHAVVEVSAGEITIRVGGHWMRFTPSTLERSGSEPSAFQINEDGTVSFGASSQLPSEEMDMAAERFAREMLSAEAC